MIDNIYDNLPESKQEVFESLFKNDDVKIERIVSSGNSTPKGEWLEQDKNEWVIVLSGFGELLFEGEEQPFKMRPGDYIFIPAGKKHRVERTDDSRNTIWLSVHF